MKYDKSYSSSNRREKAEKHKSIREEKSLFLTQENGRKALECRIAQGTGSGTTRMTQIITHPRGYPTNEPKLHHLIYILTVLYPF